MTKTKKQGEKPEATAEKSTPKPITTDKDAKVPVATRTTRKQVPKKRDTSKETSALLT